MTYWKPEVMLMGTVELLIRCGPALKQYFPIIESPFPDEVSPCYEAEQ